MSQIRFVGRPFALALLCSLWYAPVLLSADGGDSQSPRITANNTVQLRENIGREVTVYGRVIRTATSSRSRHQFLNFEGDALSVICFAEDVARFEEGGPAQLYKDRNVQVTGELELYRDKPQIKLRHPSQIKILHADSSSSTAPRSPPVATLKKIGPDTWLSPAGLRYQGRDPAGLTRVEHVLRHARDMPDRDGPHGVFDGGEERVFAVIDEAWRLAQQQGIRPDRERDRSTYLVPMGRRIGYLGGRAGAARGKPALSRVFLVIETRSKCVITAFPR